MVLQTEFYYREILQLATMIFIDCDFGCEDDEYIKIDVAEKNEQSEAVCEIFYKNKKYSYTQKFDMSMSKVSNIKLCLYFCANQIFGFILPWGILTGVNPVKFLKTNGELSLEKSMVTHTRQSIVKQCLDAENSISINKKDRCFYVHIPFCKSKCSYCSFVSKGVDENDEILEKYLDALILHINSVKKYIKNVKSIYIGGGTPTILSVNQLERLLRCIEDNVLSFEEFTVEAGRVDTINQDKLSLLKKYGVDRISINPQSLSDDTLVKIGRNHTAEDVINCVNMARKIGFKTINMDIICGLDDSFEQTVDKIVELSPENITMHTLAIKKGSLYKKHEKVKDINKDIEYFYKKMYDSIYQPYYLYRQQYMIAPFENIGFTKQGHISMYNVAMMEDLCDILAVGASSTTKIGGKSIYNAKFPEDYIKNIENIITNTLKEWKNYGSKI